MGCIMRVNSISAKNYRPFKRLDETKLNSLAVLIGKNDSGKSSILRALQAFLSNKPLQQSDLHHGATDDDNICIEVSFNSLPEKVKFEKDVDTTLEEENLVDNNCHLRIRKTYSSKDLKPKIELIVNDFENEDFFGLINLKEKKINALCDSMSIDYSKSGRSITNKNKRNQIRQLAIKNSIPLVELPLTPEKNVWSEINKLLPKFDLFETDTKLGINETTFQNKFNPIVNSATNNKGVIWAKNYFEKEIEKALQKEVNGIFEQFQKHNQDFKNFTVKTEFAWEKSVKFDIIGEDTFSVKTSIEERGSGIRRLLMVSFFQHMAQDNHEAKNLIFGIEEPENSLHPGLQRELFKSLMKIANDGHQIIVTSHSPVFAGSADMSSLSLISRDGGMAEAKQSSDFNASKIAEELGVEPSDQITSFNACVFVEGKDDIEFFNEIASKMKADGRISEDFEDKNIGFIISGGANLKHFVDANALNKLSRRFGVVIDSDRKHPDQNIPRRKLNWKSKCELDGGKFFILRKREIENYICPEVIDRELGIQDTYDDFSDMKKTFGPNIYKLMNKMSLEEIDKMGYYKDNEGNSHSELSEIVEELLNLA